MDMAQMFQERKPSHKRITFSRPPAFGWILKLFWNGCYRDFEVQDLPPPLKDDRSSVIRQKIIPAWETELKHFNNRKTHNGTSDSTQKSTPSLTKALLRIFGCRIFIYTIILAMQELIVLFVQPTAVGKLINFFAVRPTPKDETKAYIFTAIVLVCSAVKIFMYHINVMFMTQTGMQVRVACSTLLYRKALRLSQVTLNTGAANRAINLLSNDVNNFDNAIIYAQYLWIGPLMTIITAYMIYQLVGITGLIGILILLIFIPLPGFFSKYIANVRQRAAEATDARIRLINEIISGMQVIKMCVLEYSFKKEIDRARKKELGLIKLGLYLQGIVMLLLLVSTKISLFVTILAVVVCEKPVAAETVFILIAYYNILREVMTFHFPRSVAHMVATFVSIGRIEQFLMEEEEVPDMAVNLSPGSDEEKREQGTSEESHRTVVKLGEAAVDLKRVSARWSNTASKDTLKEISISVQPGQLVAVVGQVGSGKSSLSNVILRELPTSSGVVSIPNRVSYASQEPWLFAASVRQNILFGRPLDQKKYDEVVRVCQLRRDFSLLPFGDRTIVSDRGISLSGGQRARINLARAVYADAPLYLLDDPLSAVDAHVGKHIFEECIEKYLSGRTRILVTHQVQFLKNVEKIIVMRDGEIVAEGTYDELTEMDPTFGDAESFSSDNNDSLTSFMLTSDDSITNSSSRHPSMSEQFPPEEVMEVRSKGRLQRGVWSSYFKAAGSPCAIFVVVLLFVSTQLCMNGSDYVIALWAGWHPSDRADLPVSTSASIPRETFIAIFGGLIFLVIVLGIIRTIFFFRMTLRAAKHLHDQMFNSVIHATARFLNTNPSGRILNRFSKDLQIIDGTLPFTMIGTFEIMLFLLGAILIVSTVNPWLLIPAPLIGALLYSIRLIYLASSYNIKRLEAATKSPLINHLNTSIQGLATIKALDACEDFRYIFEQHQDLHSSTWYILIASIRTFSFWLDIVCLIYMGLVLGGLFFFPDDTYSKEPGKVGLAVTQCIALVGVFQSGIKRSAELETDMVSVERVLEYTKLERESLKSKSKNKPNEKWPEEGKIEFKSVYLSYDPLVSPVLKNLNFTIEPRERVGIVGRTGAGKSSLIAALFRLADIGGKIEIDGVDTVNIGLHDLRSKISVIPQEPFLFAGSLRKNLDPFEQYTDGVLWAALEVVELKEMGLEMHVSDGGGNLSVGQRQLVCLARAIVRNNRILVLDEATANVDLRTDELIQETIRRKFTNCTVLTIAHRLNTVIDCDRILVIDSGRVVEFDHPWVLLRNGRQFAKLVQENDVTTKKFLTETAERNYKVNQANA